MKKTFLQKKAIGFYATVLTFLCLLAGLISFIVLIQGPVEADENPTMVIVLAIAAMALCLVAAYRDLFKVPTLAAFVCTVALTFFYIRGRVSYLAYYFSGDVMGTGLSPMFIVGAVCFITALAASACGMCMEQEKSC